MDLLFGHFHQRFLTTWAVRKAWVWRSRSAGLPILSLWVVHSCRDWMFTNNDRESLCLLWLNQSATALSSSSRLGVSLRLSSAISLCLRLRTRRWKRLTSYLSRFVWYCLLKCVVEDVIGVGSAFARARLGSLSVNFDFVAPFYYDLRSFCLKYATCLWLLLGCSTGYWRETRFPYIIVA